MSSTQDPRDTPSEQDDPQTIAYDPTDPFWQDTEDDNDDMDFFPAEGGSGEDESESIDAHFHGTYWTYQEVAIPARLTMISQMQQRTSVESR